jgi:pyrroline-5-carboxylate reductase
MNISVIRAMPNTPAMIKQSSIGLMANKITSNEQKQLTEKILSSVGTCLWVEQESMLDAITALSGSGPAYFFFMIEAMTKAGIELGLDEEIARKFSIKTALGASMMADKSKYTPSQLRANVTSEKGVTESAIESLKKQNFEQIIANMMRVGFIRAQEIGFELGNND